MLKLRLAIPILALALAGCGGAADDDGLPTASGGSAPAASSSPGAADPDQARKYAACMRENGLPNFPDPGPDGRFDLDQFRGAGGELDRDKLRTAGEACRALAPNGGQRPELDPAQQEQLRQWAQCMRDNGVDVPDPDPNGGGLGLGEGGNGTFDRDNPTFQKAMEACKDKFTFRQRGGN
jgi:hypothetical protein